MSDHIEKVAQRSKAKPKKYFLLFKLFVIKHLDIVSFWEHYKHDFFISKKVNINISEYLSMLNANQFTVIVSKICYIASPVFLFILCLHPRLPEELQK